MQNREDEPGSPGTRGTTSFARTTPTTTLPPLLGDDNESNRSGSNKATLVTLRDVARSSGKLAGDTRSLQLRPSAPAFCAEDTPGKARTVTAGSSPMPLILTRVTNLAGASFFEIDHLNAPAHWLFPALW
ncbi:hypothetical protein [Actinobaculum massiliense]|uniref:hypothetical protein n=1 Tax=Actinobaculum massiliense TaxID=202789 RepID=UPI00030E859C|nr:hypothetical protein [Actinobaculum massiliense]MDK8318433.1 hypothetical protein [Actinobaculum massiliense]MDK8566849.1 hypothetical protein [Actinobaculum massiliense]